MILQSLHALYDRLVEEPAYELAPPGFSPQKISFRMRIRPDGTLVQPEDARVTNAAGKEVTDRMEVPGEAKPPGAGINPGFLWDNQTYMLGRQPADKPPGFGQKRFEAFRQRHLALESAIGQPEFSAVCRFLEQWTPERLAKYPLLAEVGTGFGVFQLLGEPKPVHSLKAIRDWWVKNLPTGEDALKGQCLITGETETIARLHPKIKGVMNAQPAGAPLVSFEGTAYRSYGKEQSYNSPVGETAAFRYGTALNALLSGPQSRKHRLRIGDSTCVFWTDQKTIVEDVFAAFANGGGPLAEVQDEELRAKLQIFIEALNKGYEKYSDLAENPNRTQFYLLGLAPNAARLSVRFFHRSSISKLLDHLRQHTADIRIVREFEHSAGKRQADSEFPAYWEFLRETVRQGDDPPPLLAGALMRSILESTPYPESLLGAVVRRVRTECADKELRNRAVNYLRAAAIKAVLTRNHQLTISFMLDPNNTSPAYLRGRLFAVLEKIQEEGHREQTGGGSLTKTIRDTYFAAACATPASVLSRLQVLSTHHRRYLKPGRKVQFDQMIGDIEWPLSPNAGSAKSHTLEEQGLFILGYYHQRKDLFTRKEVPSETTATAA